MNRLSVFKSTIIKKSRIFSLSKAIDETRTWPEALTIDATYKINAHKLPLVNIVDTSNASSVKGKNRLQTFAVAAAFVNNKKEPAYTWILEELRDAVWSKENSFQPPSVIVTDNEQKSTSQFIVSRISLKKQYQLNDFTYKSFFTTFGYVDRAKAEEVVKRHLETLKPLIKPKDIGHWANEKLLTLEADLKTRSLDLYWQLVEQENSQSETRALARLEEAVYLRTRKRTLKDVLNQLESTEKSQKVLKVVNSSDEPLNEVSLSTKSGVSGYSSPNSNENDIRSSLKQYILCYDELTPLKQNKINRLDVKRYDSILMDLEDILKISSINYFENGNNVEAKELSTEDSEIVQAFIRAIYYKKEFDSILDKVEQMPLFNFLHITYDNIVNEIPALLTKKNHEEEFKINHILAILKYTFQDSKNGLTLRCDIPSQAYENTDKDLFSIIRVDFTVYWRDIEIVVIKVKPLNAYDRLVELDEAGLGELSKKLLHKRMATATSEKEFSTFSMCVNGTNMNMHQMKYDHGKYTYTKLNTAILPTLSTTFTNMQLSLESIIAFKNLILNTLPTEADKDKPYLHGVTEKMKPTTLYLL